MGPIKGKVEIKWPEISKDIVVGVLLSAYLDLSEGRWHEGAFWGLCRGNASSG